MVTCYAASASHLLPELPGWTAGPASMSRDSTGDFLLRTYERGRASAFAEVTAGKGAAQVVAQASALPLGGSAEGKVESRTWMLRDRKAHLVISNGTVHGLSVILRGGPGDLAGSVRLAIHGKGLRPDDAIGLALGLDWDTITAALAGQHLFDPARVAAATRAPPPPRNQPLLWPMLPSLRSMERIERLERQRPPRFAVGKMPTITGVPHPGSDTLPAGADTGDASLRFAAMPPPVLVIGQRAFAPDLIWSAGLHFASARLRDALGLDAGTVVFRNVEAGGSEAAARAADYKAFRVVHEADPVDLTAMYGHEPDREPDGRPTVAWLLSISGPHAPRRRTVWHGGFVPPAPLFRDLMGRLIATDALAERVTRAGLEDVLFQDVASEASLHGLAVRP